MFGMGLGEVLLVLIIAIIFLGPDKLPDAMMQTAKAFRTIKKSFTEAKSAIDEELKISELKKDAEMYKKKLENSAKEIVEDTKIEESSREIKDLFGDLNDDPNKKAE